MAGLGRLIGQILDGKYHLDRLLGQGGMGAVFLATHLGTKRPVALKVIAPQLMTNEEVGARFHREAEAAGRLRHPNVVNVTDFGVAQLERERIAYLVMEYLDGNSLGDVLKQRGQLPLRFTVDIVEQVCLAIGAAHEQGIIHRDLKPDNIWLQPDRRGGYIVKVLDFGLAKLRDTAAGDTEDAPGEVPAAELSARIEARASRGTIPALVTTKAHSGEHTNPEAATRIQPDAVESDQTILFDDPPEIEPEGATRIQPAPDSYEDDGATRIQPAPERTGQAQASPPTAGRGAPSGAGQSFPAGGTQFRTGATVELTRFGSVLGTPLYMSPEQCRGEALDVRSDIYSLGVIVYQMLAGEAPFSGSMVELITRHTDEPPPPLEAKRSDIPPPVAQLVMSALAKKPAERPATAQAFAGALRSTAEGEKELLRDSKSYYFTSQRLLLGLALLVYIPFVVISILVNLGLGAALEMNTPAKAGLLYVCLLALMLFATKLSTAASAAAIKELRSMPVESVKLKSLARIVLKRTPALLLTAARSYARIFFGLLRFIVPGASGYVSHALFPAVVMLEEEKGAAALERSHRLVRPLRSLAAAMMIREIGISLGSLVFFPFITVTMAMIFGGSGADSLAALANSSMRMFVVVYCWFFMSMLHTPYTAMPLALLYYKTRQANGEAVEESSRGEALQEESKRQPARLSRPTLAWLAIPLVMLVIMIIFPLVGGGQSLIEAVRRGRTDTVNRMLAEGGNPNSTRIGGTTALMYAARDGHVAIVKSLIAAGANLHARDADGDTPLMYAAMEGRGETLEALIAAGADINARNKSGETALTLAAQRGRTGIVRALIAAGAQAAAADNKGKTAFEHAQEEGHTDTAEVLKGADSH
jgi:serine/threonine protein kinase